jgi:hypothetical protein
VLGHDKSRAIKPYAKRGEVMEPSEWPLLMYAGDGISDFSAAKETELLFAKAGEGGSSHVLSIFCAKGLCAWANPNIVDYHIGGKLPYTEFERWKVTLILTNYTIPVLIRDTSWYCSTSAYSIFINDSAITHLRVR